MTKNPRQLRQEQLFMVISEYLQNLGVIQKSFSAGIGIGKNPHVRKLELTVRSLNLQRLP
jgi:hypothetical protein